MENQGQEVVNNIQANPRAEVEKKGAKHRGKILVETENQDQK